MQHVHVKSEAASGMQNNTTLCLCKKKKKAPLDIIQRAVV